MWWRGRWSLDALVHGVGLGGGCLAAQIVNDDGWYFCGIRGDFACSESIVRSNLPSDITCGKGQGHWAAARWSPRYYEYVFFTSAETTSSYISICDELGGTNIEKEEGGGQ